VTLGSARGVVPTTAGEARLRTWTIQGRVDQGAKLVIGDGRSVVGSQLDGPLAGAQMRMAIGERSDAVLTPAVERYSVPPHTDVETATPDRVRGHLVGQSDVGLGIHVQDQIVHTVEQWAMGRVDRIDVSANGVIKLASFHPGRVRHHGSGVPPANVPERRVGGAARVPIARTALVLPPRPAEQNAEARDRQLCVRFSGPYSLREEIGVQQRGRVEHFEANDRIRIWRDVRDTQQAT
jgi:hypothetical protein